MKSVIVFHLGISWLPKFVVNSFLWLWLWTLSIWKDILELYNCCLESINQFYDLRVSNAKLLAKIRAETAYAAACFKVSEFVTSLFVMRLIILERSQNFLQLLCFLLFHLKSSSWRKLSFFQIGQFWFLSLMV